MQTLARICIQRPVFAAMLSLALVVVGAVAYFRLGVDRFPAVDLPTIMVRTTLPGGAPEDVESEISEEIEEAVNTVEGITELRSISSSGSSIVIATFGLDRDVDSAAQDVRDRVQAVLRNLPVGTDPPVIRKQDNDSTPVMSLALSADRPIRELTEVADKIVRVQLERSSGVGEVRVVGGQERAIKIWLSADRLAAYGLPITAVRDAIAEQNANIPAGNITGRQEERTLRTMGRLEDAGAFNDLVVATVDGKPVRVRDVGRAEDGTYEQRSLARLDGRPTVVLDVVRQSGANTVAVIEAVKANLAKISEQLPEDVKLEIIRDQSGYIYTALHEINVHLVLGSILACAVVLLFMRSWRSTIIAAVAIPTSVVATFGMMWALDFTLNSVTMLALVLMVGIVIDDAIVVLENIFRFVEEKRLDPFEAARAATQEIGLAVLATTLSLVVIFAPVSFMSSISGRFLFQFGITATVAILVSLLVSFSLTPMMSARLLRGEGGHAHGGASGDGGARRGFYGRIEALYMRALSFAMRRRAIVAAFGLLVVASAAPLYGLVKQEYIPSGADDAEFEIRVSAPLSASIGAMDDVMRRISDDVSEVRGVRSVLVTAGGSFVSGVSSGEAFVRLAPHDERTFSVTRLLRETLAGNPLRAFQGNYSQRDVMQEVRRTLRKYTDLRISVRNVPSFNIGGGNFEIDFAIQGPEIRALERYANELRERSAELGGIVDADVTLKIDRPELRVVIDRARAADLGVRTEDIATALRLMVGGDPSVSRFRDESANENYDVQLRLIEEDRDGLEAVRRLYVPRTTRAAAAPGGGGGAAAPASASPLLRGDLVRLDNLVRIERAESPSRIDRLDRQRVSSLRAGVGPGFALADRLEALRGAAREMDMPSSYSFSVRGRGAELERTFNEFIWAFLLSIVLMYMILASQFESLVHPITILLALPLSVPFALLSLWATGNTLNLYSALGFLVLFGVVKKNSILQVDHMNKLRAAGMPRAEAILQANRDRLRPILMTTLALVAGMLPLWLGTGPGAEERHAIAVVVIGGQSLSLFLTLVVTPVSYSLLDDLGRSERWSRVQARASALRAAVSGQMSRLRSRGTT
ncbi:RND transporter [Sorangium cellulosum]|uniref:RND transporter n=1 Tax=Sorangium cellulosum TaxID=56 RepID=A0A4P2PXH7_SORCE|nr:efflux RND transporter permease subunit [Sorangium cellulosum]AUX21575.1 RND transporter [Sorangium cellulosum]